MGRAGRGGAGRGRGSWVTRGARGGGRAGRGEGFVTRDFGRGVWGEMERVFFFFFFFFFFFCFFSDDGYLEGEREIEGEK